jgi:alkylated DNA repair protein (DNA oxidative demethylase)
MRDPLPPPSSDAPDPRGPAPRAEDRVELQPGLWLLRGFVAPASLREPLVRVLEAAPPRHFVTPGGQAMAAAMTNCGPLGWTSDRAGYRYSAVDPATGRPWPSLPPEFATLAREAAAAAGFAAFAPDACLVNRYRPGAGMTAHQDRDERDFGAPIVSVSLGLPARFFWQEGTMRRGPSRSVALASGDVVVFGGESRRMYHGVRPVREGADPVFGPYRYNLTLRKAA